MHLYKGKKGYKTNCYYMPSDNLKSKSSAVESLVNAFVKVLDNAEMQEQFNKASKRSAEALGSKSIKYLS